MKHWRIPTPAELERMVPPIEVYLSNLNADKLKKLARRWTGKDANKMNKEQALTAVKKGFEDPPGGPGAGRASFGLRTGRAWAHQAAWRQDRLYRGDCRRALNAWPAVQR